MNIGEALKLAMDASTGFSEAKAISASIEEEMASHADVLKSFPRSAVGLVSNEVRLDPKYVAAKSGYDRAFAKLRKFNEVYVKRFAKELRAERDERRRLLIESSRLG